MATRTRERRREGRGRTLGAILLAGSLVAAAGEARATLAAYRSTRELAEDASSIFRGLVLDRVSHWQGEWIVTDVLVSVDECWAGRCPDSVAVVRELGGEVDGVGLLSPEPSALSIGEAVVVFGRQAGSVLLTVGGAQGVFRVEHASELVRRDLASIASPRVVPEHPMTVRALRREVARALAREEEGR